ncbi:MAG: glycyl-radical enzyme activating protein [Negativicutes bacterium]|nr:glycyl-radical enzyme activating protein [Negativicutes bacterium]
MNQASGNIFQIQRWSIHDGEGIRSTVFLKGCPLRCRWCANPESWNSQPEVLYFHERCGGCGRCARICDAGAIAIKGSTQKEFKRASCRGCGKCCEVCPTSARKKIGSTVTVDEVLQVIRRDAIFYRESGGGITFSGGEPFAQPDFLRQLVTACNRLGIDTAVETCGYFDWEQVKDIFALLDAVFVDIKHMDDEVHTRLTGIGNRRILENIIMISKMHPQAVVRVPLIAEMNANEENIRRMCKFLRQNTQVERVELLPYHDFGEAKYSAVEAAHQSLSAPDAATVEGIKRIIADYGIRVIDFK